MRPRERLSLRWPQSSHLKKLASALAGVQNLRSGHWELARRAMYVTVTVFGGRMPPSALLLLPPTMPWA